jgi:glycosyltransferase involved in cell wall biosynthesis
VASTNNLARGAAIVVPCYNEAKRLRVDEFHSFLASHGPEILFLFVDDGSRDNTLEVLETIRAAHPDRVEVLRMPRNSGKAEAVRAGMKHSFDRGFALAGFWDADLATPLWEIPEFLNLLDQRPELDMVFGARVKLLGRKIERKSSRHYLGRVFATAASTVLRLAIYDTQCGAKIFRSTAQVRSAFEEPFLSRWVFDVEVIARYAVAMKSVQAAAAGIYEFPLHEWNDVAGSKLSAWDFAIAAGDLLKIHRKYKIR